MSDTNKQLKLVLLLARNWLEGDRKDADEIGELVVELTPPEAARQSAGHAAAPTKK